MSANSPSHTYLWGLLLRHFVVNSMLNSFIAKFVRYNATLRRKTAKKLSMKLNELIAWRRTLGLTTSEAAKSLGVTPNAYRAMETGKSTISKRTELACAALYLGADKIAQPWLH